MDQLDRIILNAVQTAFPAESNPYQVLGALAGINEDEAFNRIGKLREEGIIRRLGGVFNSQRLGYFSTLCAAKVPGEKLSSLVELINVHPGVTHNYLRDHEYNLWFTLISPSQAVAEKTLDNWKRETGVQEIYSLPAIRLFKIKVDFDFQGGESQGSLNSPSDQPLASENQNMKTSGQDGNQISFSAEDKALVRRLQDDLPHVKNPFAIIAKQLGRTEEAILNDTKRMIAGGAIRRFGAVLRHQKAGFKANGMGVWQVPEHCIEETGKVMASFREVSHCYQRPPLTDWPYNLFTMIHGTTVDECRDVMRRISEATGMKEYSMLFSIKELKKCSMKYFMEDESKAE